MLRRRKNRPPHRQKKRRRNCEVEGKQPPTRHVYQTLQVCRLAGRPGRRERPDVRSHLACEVVETAAASPEPRSRPSAATAATTAALPILAGARLLSPAGLDGLLPPVVFFLFFFCLSLHVFLHGALRCEV